MESEGAGPTEKSGNFQMVTAVGNAWLMSRSKSYNGRVYYFNTATGEAVWNLTDEEIEKAKACPPKLKWESRSGVLPEPEGPPGNVVTPADPNIVQQSQVPKYETPKVYNKQIINNQFTRTPYTPFVAAPCQICNPLNPAQNMIPQQPYNSVWIQPPQVFLTSSPSTSMHNLNQTVQHVCHHQQFHQSFAANNTPISLSRPFEFANQQHKNLINRSQGNKFKRRINTFNARKQPFVPKRIQTQKNIGDLRLKLSAKKTVMKEIPNETQQIIQNNVQDGVNSDNTTQGSQTSSNLESRATQNVLHSNTADDEWLKIHGKLDGAKLKLDTTVLKNFATDNLECECWYIVADRNVLLYHFNFLNVLSTSDEQCKLMVVRGVLAGLQAAARADASKDGPRKVLRGLSKMFAAQRAVIGEYSFEAAEIKDCSGMVNFCTKLLEQNDHLILLSNEEGLDKLSTKVPTFSISEVKELLIGHKYKSRTPIIERNIKITIPNYEVNDEADDMEMSANTMETTAYDEETSAYNEDATLNQEETLLHDVGTKTHNVENSVDEMEIAAEKIISPNKKDTIVQTGNILYAVKMVDAEVQTEPRLDLLYPNIQKDSIGVNTVENDINVARYVDRETSVDKSIGVENIAISNEVSQTREIRLKRSISNQTVRSTNNKWHRKKRDDSRLSDSTNSLDRVSRMSNAAFESNNLLQDLPCQSRCQSTQMCYEYEDSETSSCILQKRPSSENIVIEETSTSDVISNSVSNENIHLINKSKEKADEVQSKNVMFEITSKAMELNLKTRCDEWLAQFSQIMEEVLGQVLEREAQHVASAMPPPWTLHEATECVKRIFSRDSDVVDAATKLSQVIYKMSDAKGKFIVQFKPNDFMELYSYGVYLVDALQSIMEKFDDLQIAAESLSKLLSDIENPIDCSHNNSFDDTTDISVVISQSSADGPANKETLSVSNKSSCIQSFLNKSTPIGTQGGVNKSTPTKKQGSTTAGPQGGEENKSPTEKQGSLNRSNPSTPRKNVKAADADSNKSSGKYNLRSANKKKINEDKRETSPVKFIRKVNIHDAFFTSLHLKRKDETAAVSRILKNANTNVDDKNKKPTNKSPGADKPADKGPNIIRNFSRCLEFEERLERLEKQSRAPLDMDMLDYSMCYDDEYDNMEETYLDDFNRNQEHITEETSQRIFENDLDKSTDFNNNDFKVFVSSLVNEIRETIASVQKFCKKIQEELQSQNMQISRKNEVRDKALNAKSRIRSVCDSLRRIKECDFNENGDRFQSRLKEAGVLLNENEVLVYREVIDSCVGHGDILAESLNLIIDAVNA